MSASFFRRLISQPDLVVAAGIIGLIAMMLVPLPPVVLDLLLTLNLALALCIILVAMYVTEPLDFSIFPSLLLVATLFRLALNVSSTRLVLLHAHAGRVIEAFGNFVVGGDLVVGLVVFLILVVIQFIVITNGAGRVAEVAARFTLDEMPGKQMSIDADLNAGLVDEAGARKRRKNIEREADFYGAMDGASKFVRGDAIVGIIIVLINILGGLAIGVLRMHMPVAEALHRYALLTVGDGLVTQIPALLISTATGLVVTRAASEQNMGGDILAQLIAQPRAVLIAAVLLLCMGMVPGLPKFSFFLVGGLAGTGGYLLLQKEQHEAAQEPPPKAPDLGFDHALVIDRIGIQVGYGLLGLMDGRESDASPARSLASAASSPPANPNGLLGRIDGIRRQLATDLGIVVPPIRIRDDISLGPNEYVIRVRGAISARGEVRPSRLLALSPGAAAAEIPGEDTRDPAFELPAKWIAPSERILAEARGYTVIEPSAVMATHLSETIKRHADDLLSLQDVHELVERVRTQQPALVSALIPDGATLSDVQRLLRGLLAEGVSIRDLPAVLEAMLDALRFTRKPEEVLEIVRLAVAPAICDRYRHSDDILHVITLDPDIEREVQAGVVETERGSVCALEPRFLQEIIRQVQAASERMLSEGIEPVILAAPQVRRHVRGLLARSFPTMPVLSHAEIPTQIQVRQAAVVA